MSDGENRDTSRKIFSSDGKVFFKLVEGSEKYFSLEKYIICYDDEEEVEYTIRQRPDPSGRYESIEAATKEAKRILG